MTSVSLGPWEGGERNRYESFQRFFEAYLRLWSILLYLGVYQSDFAKPSPSLPAVTSCPRLVLHPAHLGGSRCKGASGSQVRGQGSSKEQCNDIQTLSDWPLLWTSVCMWRWLNAWKETVHQWEIWKQFDCIKAFKASPLISLLASRQCHTHPLLCAARRRRRRRRSAQKAFHNYAFTCLFASSFTHLFIHLFICYRLTFDPAVICLLTDELWLLFANLCVCMLCVCVCHLDE